MARFSAESVENGADRATDIFTGRLRGLDVHIGAPIAAYGPSIKQVAQGQKRRCLAGLPGSG